MFPYMHWKTYQINFMFCSVNNNLGTSIEEGGKPIVFAHIFFCPFFLSDPLRFFLFFISVWRASSSYSLKFRVPMINSLSFPSSENVLTSFHSRKLFFFFLVVKFFTGNSFLPALETGCLFPCPLHRVWWEIRSLLIILTLVRSCHLLLLSRCFLFIVRIVIVMGLALNFCGFITIWGSCIFLNL